VIKIGGRFVTEGSFVIKKRGRFVTGRFSVVKKEGRLIRECDGRAITATTIKIYWSDKACFVIHDQVKVNFDAPGFCFIQGV